MEGLTLESYVEIQKKNDTPHNTPNGYGSCSKIRIGIKVLCPSLVVDHHFWILLLRLSP